MHRIGAGHDETEYGVSALVIRDALAVVRLSSIGRSGPSTIFSSASRKSFCATSFCSRRAASRAASLTRFLMSAPENPGRRGSDLRQARRRSRAAPARVNFEDRLAPDLVRKIDHHAPIEASGPQERLVQHVGLIGRRQHDHALAAGETIHLGEDLVQRLLLLARAADRHLPARAADRIQLVDEDDRRRVLACLLEQIPHARRTHADDHFDELRRAHRKERHARFARDGARQQGLARAGRADQQHALWSGSAQPRVLLRVLEEVDDLHELVLRFVDAGDIVEGHLRFLLLVVAPGFALADAHHPAAHAAALLRAAGTARRRSR